MFVDYGNVEVVSTGVLCELCEEDTVLSMQAIECQLANVRPSLQSSSDGKWSSEANLCLKELTLNKYLAIEVRDTPTFISLKYCKLNCILSRL